MNEEPVTIYGAISAVEISSPGADPLRNTSGVSSVLGFSSQSLLQTILDINPNQPWRSK